MTKTETKIGTVRTDRQIQALKFDGKPYWVTVNGSPGLRIKVTHARGKTVRTFCYRYRAADGRQELKVIGQYEPPDFGLEEANETWRQMRRIRRSHGSVRDYLDRERRENIEKLQQAKVAADQAAFSVNKLVDQFVDYQSTAIKTWRETKRVLERHIVPNLGSLPANEVKRGQVTAILDELAAAGKRVQANRVLAATRAMFNWALERERDGIEFNPCGAIKPRKEHGRDRALSDVELQRLLVYLPKTNLSTDARDLLEFILLTGCRLTEAADARMVEFDDDANLWVLPESRSKNKRSHRLPLSDQAVVLIKRRRGSSNYLFPRHDDDGRSLRTDHIHGPLREAIKTLNQNPKSKLLPFTPHDLRRTVATGIAALGAPRDIVRRVLNHVDPSVTAIYDRADHTPEMRKWLQKWGEHLDSLRRSRPKKGERRMTEPE